MESVTIVLCITDQTQSSKAQNADDDLKSLLEADLDLSRILAIATAPNTRALEVHRVEPARRAW